MTLLDADVEAASACLPVGKQLPAAAEIPATRMPCEASGEPLELIDRVPTLDAYHALDILPSRPLLTRASVHARLTSAADALPDGFQFVVLDGWRSLTEQRRLIDYYSENGPTEGFVASADPSAMRPPHVTGAAIDLTLQWQGQPLALGTDYDSFSDHAALDAFESSDGPVRRLRRCMAEALFNAGFAPYQMEWWHWSYGDDVWAASFGQAALYDLLPG